MGRGPDSEQCTQAQLTLLTAFAVSPSGTMADTQPPPLTDDQLDKLRADATAAAAKVKQMKKDGASKVRLGPVIAMRHSVGSGTGPPCLGFSSRGLSTARVYSSRRAGAMYRRRSCLW